MELFKTRPMMKCGCVAMATYTHKGENGVACITHDCKEVAKVAPDLTGRKARCAYYGQPVKTSSYNSNCCDTCKGGENCACERDSSSGLWFFEFQGEGSKAATETCKNCGAYKNWHWPLWEVTLKQTRRWFKIDPSVSEDKYTQHLPNKDMAQMWAEKESDRRLHWSDHDEETKVRKVEIISLKEINNPHKCKNFEEKGSFPYDKFYCACHGAD